jgi:hypothetical protein
MTAGFQNEYDNEHNMIKNISSFKLLMANRKIESMAMLELLYSTKCTTPALMLD